MVDNSESLKTANRIKDLRKERSWSQKDLANFLSMESDSSVTHWEKGRYYPKGRELIGMAKLFNVSTDYILGLTDKRNWDK